VLMLMLMAVTAYQAGVQYVLAAFAAPFLIPRCIPSGAMRFAER
jgi:hypothetical protein